MTTLYVPLQITQWYDNDSHVIGVYEPNYEEGLGNTTGDEQSALDYPHHLDQTGEGNLIEWNGAKIRWQTLDGKRPKDFVHVMKCSILSDFAVILNLGCEQAITVAFVIGFGALFVILLVVFLVFKRR